MSTIHATYTNAWAVKTGVGALSGLFAHNKAASTIFLLIFDRETDPENDDPPDFPAIPLAAGVYYESGKRREFKRGCFIRASDSAEALSPATEDVKLSFEVA